MLVPIEWLKDYAEVKVSIDEFCDKMIMSGSNLESCQHMCGDIDKVVVGKINKIEKHPDADKLVICRVDVGENEDLQIVTGAPNVFEGAWVPVALHGSTIPGPLHGQEKKEGGTKIKKGKLRGVESFGMLCSAGELGFDDKVVPVAHKDGIWILPEDFAPGQDFNEALKLKQDVVDFEITPNRPDCLSMIGMARETAATFDEKLDYPETVPENESDETAQSRIKVRIEKPQMCKRYAARVVKDVKIEQSPWWLQKRLMYAGMRPINNIVDITNFVMLEYGQPMHAFDIKQIKSGEIVVDTAEEGEKFVTLDGTERTLDSSMLLIKDGDKGVALAGVMGGLDSEIEDDTTTILVESANFEKDCIRKTSKKLGLRTEASSRYEKGIDPNLCQAAADRFCRLVEELGAGTVLTGTVDVYPNEERPRTVQVRVDRVNKVLGLKLSGGEMVDYFRRLEIKAEDKGETIEATAPTVRQDLVSEIDYVEEVARMYGYDKMPVTLPKDSAEAKTPRGRSLRDLAGDVLCSMGCNEVQTYSFVSPKGVDRVRIDEDSWERNFVKLKNPLGEENSVMRTILTPNMLEVLGRNYSRNIETVAAFEMGNTFNVNMMEPKALPDEQYALCIGLYGSERNFFTLKGMLEELFACLGVKNVSYVAESGYGVYHPGRCAKIMVDTGECGDKEAVMKQLNERFAQDKENIGEDEMAIMKNMVDAITGNRGQGLVELGIMGEIYPDVAEAYGIDVRCYCCELFFDTVAEFAHTEVEYKPLPKYPATARDIALLVDEAVQIGSVEEIIRDKGGKILEDVNLFDIYRGKQVEDGKKSIAFTLTYRSPEKTLTDEEVIQVHEKILKSLKQEINAVLRDM